MHTGVAPSDLPEGLSPDNQDMAYVPGEVFSRPCLAAIFSPELPGDAQVMYTKTYVLPDGTPLTLALDSNGILYVENVSSAPGVANPLATITARESPRFRPRPSGGNTLPSPTCCMGRGRHCSMTAPT